MKTKKNKIAIVLISILTLVVSPASTGITNIRIDRVSNSLSPLAEATFSDGLPIQDEKWPIIKYETRNRKDSLTGQETIETIIVRQEPPSKSKDACQEMHQNKSNQEIAPDATCIRNRFAVVMSAQVSGAGAGVKGYAKNIADEYCNGGNCGFYKMTQLQIWWTRINTSWGVRSARTTWGCTVVCTLCSDGTTSYLFRSLYFNPTWYGLTSQKYTYSSSNMPIMRSMSDYGGLVTGGNDSLLVLPNNQTSPLSVYASYP